MTDTMGVESRGRRRAGRMRVARGLLLLGLSPVAFQLAAPLSSVLGFVAKAVASVIGFALSAMGSQRVVLGAFEALDPPAAERRELPEARALPPRTEE